MVPGTCIAGHYTAHRWEIPLDKGLFEEIQGIDSSWGESVPPSFCGSGKSEGKNSEHDCVFSDSGNIKLSTSTPAIVPAGGILQRLEAFVASPIGYGGSDAEIA
ncbi:hypothetical protein Tco_0708363 [Tanacetum coccineum]